jgi:hypothetical protein
MTKQRGIGGPGWGGPAKGPGNRGGGPGRPPGVKNGAGKRSVADLMIEGGARELAAERWIAILQDPTHPHHATMVAKAADRMDGAPTQDITSAGERVGYVIAAPAEAETTEAWTQQHGPKPPR